MNLQDIIIENEEIVIEDNAIFNAIGPRAVLKECTLRCNVSSKSLSICGQLERCRIIVKRKLTGFSWRDARLSGCTFQGIFKENSFGTAIRSSGYCESCDFSNADLDDCQFFGDNSESHKFPKWPHFVLFYPHRHFIEMQHQPKNHQLGIVINSLEFISKEVTAMTFNSKTLAKESGLSVREIENFFSQFTFVQL